jgi:hypothetical protein
VAAVAACTLLAAIGLKSLVAPAHERGAPAVTRSSTDMSAAGVAEVFARTYLTWDASGSEQRAAVLDRLMPNEDAGSSDDLGRRDQRVLWTAVVAERAGARRRRTITVAAQTTDGLVHLAVTVDRDDRGFLYVAGPPAFVGPPATAGDVSVEPEREVADAELRTVAGRVVSNYLARERDDLRADLDPRAVVTLPEEALRVVAVDAVTWIAPNRRAAVAISVAGPHGLRLALRYELSVVRRAGRWLVRTVHVNPTARESAG